MARHRNRSLATFRCRNCMFLQGSRSLKDNKWGISGLPKLNKTKEGDLVRKQKPKAGTESTKRKAQPATRRQHGWEVRSPGRAGFGAIDLPSVSPATMSADSAPLKNPDHPTSGQYPTTEAAEHPAPWGKVDGQKEVFHFEHYLWFEELLKAPGRDSLSVANGLVKLRAVLRREEAMAREVTLKFKERATAMRMLEEQMEKEIARMNAGDEVGSGPVSRGSGASGETGPSGSKSVYGRERNARLWNGNFWEKEGR